MNEHERKELAVSKTLPIVLAVVGVALVIWLAWIRPAQKKVDVNSFEECAAAGNPIQESFPEVCTTPTGQRYTNLKQQH